MDRRCFLACVHSPVCSQLDEVARVPERKQAAENGCCQIRDYFSYAQRIVPRTGRNRRGIRGTGGCCWSGFHFDCISKANEKNKNPQKEMIPYRLS